MRNDAPGIGFSDPSTQECGSGDTDRLRIWQQRLRALLGEASDHVHLHYSQGCLFLTPGAGSPALDGCVAELIAGSSDWDMVVVMPVGTDPLTLGHDARHASPQPAPNGG
jgi:hypothetical protein